MTNLDIAFQTEEATKETTIHLDTLINTLSSVKSSMNSLFGKRVSFDFKHTSISSFKVSITINDSFDQEELFEHRNEKNYDDYISILNNIISGDTINTDVSYIKSIQKLLKTISNEKEDVELTIQNDDENFRKVLYIDNKKAKDGYVRLRKILSKENVEIVNNKGTIFSLSASKSQTQIGVSFDSGNTIGLICNANERIRADILSKLYKIGDKVEFSAETEPNKKTAKLLYIDNLSNNTSLFK